MRRLVVVVVAAVVAASLAVPAVASPTKNVKVGDFFFHPGSTTITKGAKVTWTWVGAIKHNVTAYNNSHYRAHSLFKSRTQLTGTFSHIFNKRGTYYLRCSIHPTLMKEKIIVR
jgi:plastocyanin